MIYLCPKCHAGSGDDWRQCAGICPMPGSPHYHPAALFLRSPRQRTAAWTCRSIRRGDSLISIDLACDDVLARVDLRRDADRIAIAQVSFESSDARRAWAACLRAVSDVLAVTAERAEVLAQIRSWPVDLRDPVVGPLTYAVGDARLELTGSDAWLILAAAFGETYARGVSQAMQRGVAADERTRGPDLEDKESPIDHPQRNKLNGHRTTVVPHDHVHCHTARHAKGGDCGTRYEARCSCGWTQGASSRAAADAIAVGHRSYSPDAAVIVTSNIPQGEITDDQLRDLFARHCECRPLDLTRGESDHAAIHDCDTGILHDIQVALGIVRFDDIGRIQAMHEARARCAKMLLWKRNARGGWDVPRDEGP